VEPEQLAAFVEQVAPDPRGPGLIVGVVGPDGVVTAARGLAVLEHGVSIDERTVFHLASVSKQFTAEAVWALVREDRLRVDDRIVDYLPWVAFAEITVEQLVRHSSGLRDQWQLVEAAGWRMEDVITTADVIELVRRQESSQFTPGSWHSYSNTNYTLLGLLVEAVSGESLDSFCRKHFFDPLGMNDTAFVSDHRAVVPRRASSYRRTSDGYERIALSYGTAGATSLHSTVMDLARWAAAAPARESWQSPLATTAYAGSDAYGWGVRVSRHAGAVKLWHAGADAGFRTHLAMLPTEGIAVVVLGNFAELDPGALTEQILEQVRPSESSGRSAHSTAPRPSGGPTAGVQPGFYLDESRGIVVKVGVTEEGVQLDGDFGPTTLKAAADGRFTDGYVVLEPGEPLMVSEDPALRPHPWVLLAPAPTEIDGGPVGEHHTADVDEWLVGEHHTAKVDARLVGEYYSAELSAVVRVVRDADGLWLQRPRHGRLRMVPRCRWHLHLCRADHGDI